MAKEVIQQLDQSNGTPTTSTQALLATAEQMEIDLNMVDGTNTKSLDGDATPSITMDNLFNNDKIVSKLLEFFVLEELLDARILNHLWNRNVVKHLKKKNISLSVALHERNIFGFTAFVQRNNMNNFLPSICSKYRISLDGEHTQKEYDSALDCIIRLILGSGGNSIVESLRMNGNVPSATLLYLNMQKMSELFQVISPGLKYLHLGELLLLLNCNTTSSLPAEAADISHLTFPALTSLFYGIGNGNTTLLVQILHNAPNLKSLVAMRNITEFYGQMKIKIPGLIPQLKGLGNVPSTLEAVKMDLYGDETFNGLKHIRFEGLRKLHFVLIYDLPDTVKNQLTKFLETKCPQLRWLEFTLQLNTHGNLLGVIFPNPKYIPTLPNLTTFGYNINLKDGPHIGLININELKGISPTLAEKLPGLREVSTHLAAQLVAQNADAQAPPRATAAKGLCYNNPSMLNSLLFPQVETLYYKLTRDKISFKGHTVPSPKGCCGTSIVENINQLHVLYPNIKKLIVYNDMLRTSTEDTKFVILVLIQELGAGLKELQIFNYTEDWLKKILKDKRLVDNLQDLRTLKIFGDKRREFREDEEPNLNRMLPLSSLNCSPIDIEQLMEQTEKNMEVARKGTNRKGRIDFGVKRGFGAGHMSTPSSDNSPNKPLAFNLEFLMKRLPKLEVLVVSYDLLLVQSEEGRNKSELEVELEVVLAKYKSLYPSLDIQIL